MSFSELQFLKFLSGVFNGNPLQQRFIIYLFNHSIVWGNSEGYSPKG